MSENPNEPFEVLCPCCHARLRVDPEMRAILSHELPPEERSVKDLAQRFQRAGILRSIQAPLVSIAVIVMLLRE